MPYKKYAFWFLSFGFSFVAYSHPQTQFLRNKIGNLDDLNFLERKKSTSEHLLEISRWSNCIVDR